MLIDFQRREKESKVIVGTTGFPKVMWFASHDFLHVGHGTWDMQETGHAGH